MELYIQKLKIALSRSAKESFKKFLDPDCYLDHPYNLITSSSSRFRHSLKISSRSLHKFLSYVTNKRKNKRCQKHSFLGGVNKGTDISPVLCVKKETTKSNF